MTLFIVLEVSARQKGSDYHLLLSYVGYSASVRTDTKNEGWPKTKLVHIPGTTYLNLQQTVMGTKLLFWFGFFQF